MILEKFFTRHFPTPKFLEMPFVGIDISPLCIRMIEIPYGNELKVGRFEEKHLTTIFKISDENHDEIKQILSEWKKKYKLQYIKASIPEEKAYLFEKEMDFGTDETMRTAIEFTLEENVPISGSESIFDYRISGVGEGDKVKVAVTVLREEVVKKYINLFNECGLTPLSFMIEAHALSRSVIKRGDTGTYLIVNIGKTKTGLFVFSRGSVQFTSTSSIGGQDFTKAIQSKRSITAQEAEQIKKAKGFSRSEDNEILDDVCGVASLLKTEIEKISIYWHNTQVKNGSEDQIQKIVLVGSEANIPGFKEYFGQNLKMPVEIGNVWINLRSSEEYIPPIKFEDSLSFGQAIGLALPEHE